MRGLAKIFRFVLGALLAAALAASPVAAFAGLKAMPSHAAMAMDESAPCDMPCDDCGGADHAPACAVACAGLIAAIPALVAVAPPMVTITRESIPAKIPFAGREREPDKPPPRTVLA